MNSRKFGPLGAASLPSKPCPACDEPFQEGQYVTLVPLGPGSSEEGRQRAREGRPYNAVAVMVHWACATGDEE